MSDLGPSGTAPWPTAPGLPVPPPMSPFAVSPRLGLPMPSPGPAAGLARPAAPGAGLSALVPASSPAPHSPVLPTRASPQAFDPQYQRNLTTLTNKYAEMAPTVAALPPSVRNALISYDAERVAQGSSPLTRRQTLGAVHAATTNTQATPAPDRNPLNILGNVRRDLGDILASIPRLPIALVREVTEIPKLPQRIDEAIDAGANPVEAIAQAPGVRMIPGSYVVGGLAGGAEGIRELAAHPLMTGLDVLPAAGKVAGATRVGKVAAEAAELAGRRPRPLTAVLTGKVVEGVDDAGQVTASLGRNRVGQTVDLIRDQTRIGQALDAFGGRRSRDVSRMRGLYEQRYKALMMGHGTPLDDVEALAVRVPQMFERYQEAHPMFRPDSVGPEWDKQRAKFYDDLQRGRVDDYDPGLIGEYRALQDDLARAAEATGDLGSFRGEWYDRATARRLQQREAQVTSAERIAWARNEYLTPSGQVTAEQIRDAARSTTGAMGRTRDDVARAVVQVMDAYGLDVDGVSRSLADINARRGSWDGFTSAVDDALAGSPLTPRQDAARILRQLRSIEPEQRTVARLEQALRSGDRGAAGEILRTLERRRTPPLDEATMADVRSLARRYEYDGKVGRRYTDALVRRRRDGLETLAAKTAPARFHGLLADDVRAEGAARLTDTAERELGRALTAEEAGGLVRALEERRWGSLPGLDRETAARTMAQVEREVAATWQALRDAGHDPVFVHRVSPNRATDALYGRVKPSPVALSQGKQRVLDLTPGVHDVQISLTHQAGEMLQRRYNERFVDELVQAVGKPEWQLRDQLADATRARMVSDPSLDFEGHMDAAISRGWERVNPDAEGSTWGGAALDKYRQESWYVPKAVAANLKQYSRPPSLFARVTDPLTKAFRYSVVGLSPSLIINNFFSNAVAMTAESGLGPWKHWSTAREWLADPAKIPNEQLKAMLLADMPHMEHLSRDAWLASRAGQQFMSGFNAGRALMDSAPVGALQRGKAALDKVVDASMRAQRYGDNIYRAMQFMDEAGKAGRKGADAAQAEARAMEAVRRTFVDYASFTPVERQAMQTLVPFYSYMGHAARFIARYPLDHPFRASIAAHIADAEKERLGALPDSYLGMVGLGGVDDRGHQRMLGLRPFDPFGGMADLLSVSGWIAAMNPAIATALQQVGVVRGQAELYPTMRYDPETGRMKAVPGGGGVLSDLLHNTVPRAGLITAALGLNPRINELAEREPGAVPGALLGTAGIPRLVRDVNVTEERFRGEVNRQRAVNDVRNDAMRTGDWREALRYPTLQAYFDQLQQVPESHLADYVPEDPKGIAERVRGIVGG